MMALSIGLSITMLGVAVTLLGALLSVESVYGFGEVVVVTGVVIMAGTIGALALVSVFS